MHRLEATFGRCIGFLGDLKPLLEPYGVAVPSLEFRFWILAAVVLSFKDLHGQGHHMSCHLPLSLLGMSIRLFLNPREPNLVFILILFFFIHRLPLEGVVGLMLLVKMSLGNESNSLCIGVPCTLSEIIHNLEHSLFLFVSFLSARITPIMFKATYLFPSS